MSLPGASPYGTLPDYFTVMTKFNDVRMSGGNHLVCLLSASHTKMISHIYYLSIISIDMLTSISFFYKDRCQNVHLITSAMVLLHSF